MTHDLYTTTVVQAEVAQRRREAAAYRRARAARAASRPDRTARLAALWARLDAWLADVAPRGIPEDEECATC